MPEPKPIQPAPLPGGPINPESCFVAAVACADWLRHKVHKRVPPRTAARRSTNVNGLTGAQLASLFFDVLAADSTLVITEIEADPALSKGFIVALAMASAI